MSEAQITELARAIAAHTVLDAWPYWLALLALAFLGTVAGSYLSSYSARRGEVRAARDDAREILEKVRTTTKVTEEIRSAVSLGEWTERERRTLRRTKLEELLLAAFEARTWLSADEGRLLYSSPDAAKRDPLPSPIERVEVVAGLYFPELRPEVRALDQAHSAYLLWVRKTYGLALEAEAAARASGHPYPPSERNPVIEKRNEELEKYWPPVLNALFNLQAAANAQMGQITAVSRDG